MVAAPEPDALREASYFVERLGAEGMPLAGLVLNRVHGERGARSLSAARSTAAAEELDEDADAGHERPADRRPAAAARRPDAAVAEREQRLARRFTGAHPAVPVRRVPALAEDVHDLAGLRDDRRRPRRLTSSGG